MDLHDVCRLCLVTCDDWFCQRECNTAIERDESDDGQISGSCWEPARIKRKVQAAERRDRRSHKRYLEATKKTKSRVCG